MTRDPAADPPSPPPDWKSISSTVIISPETRTLFELEAEKYASLKTALLAKMNREMFEDIASIAPLITAPTWRERYMRRLSRVTRYFETLWKALKGVDLDEPSDYDY
jgi:hypothetical protein